MYTVTGPVLVPMLMALKALTGHQYEKIMTQVGWARFLTQLPDDHKYVGVASTEEVGAMYRAIFDIAGEAVLRQFMRNLGNNVSDHLIADPDFPASAAKVQQNPDPQRAALDLIALLAVKLFGSPRPMTEDQDNYYLTLVDCAICGQLINKVNKPICEMLGIFYLKLIRALSGIREINCFESTCKACGDQECMLKIPKIKK